MSAQLLFFFIGETMFYRQIMTGSLAFDIPFGGYDSAEQAVRSVLLLCDAMMIDGDLLNEEIKVNIYKGEELALFQEVTINMPSKRAGNITTITMQILHDEAA